jgi:hypothetical protein
MGRLCKEAVLTQLEILSRDLPEGIGISGNISIMIFGSCMAFKIRI